MATVALGSGKQTDDFLLWSGRGMEPPELCVSARPEGLESDIPRDRRHQQGRVQLPAAPGPGHRPSTHPEQPTKGNEKGFFWVLFEHSRAPHPSPFTTRVNYKPLTQACFPCSALFRCEIFLNRLSCHTEQGSHFKKLPERNKGFSDSFGLLGWSLGQGWCRCCVHPLPRALHLCA